ncbi:hypothetical protein TNCV_4516101 [Trichonephila clavipes]|nr:hypothetical protein TNCV_4516101 [Trichonephila clavipes]
MATGSYLTPIYSRSQSEVQGDHHKVADLCAVQGGYVQCPGGKTFTSVRGMSSGLEPEIFATVKCISSGLEAEICTGSGVCPVLKWQNNVQCQGGLEEELCLASEVWLLGIPLMLDKIQPPRLWTKPSQRTEFYLQATKHPPDARKSSATRTLDTPLTLDIVLPPGYWT